MSSKYVVAASDYLNGVSKGKHVRRAGLPTGSVEHVRGKLSPHIAPSVNPLPPRDFWTVVKAEKKGKE